MGSSHLSLASAADCVIVFSAAGSSRTVGLLTNLWPRAQSDADWCTTGVSATSLDLAVAANAAAAVRTAAVQLVAEAGGTRYDLAADTRNVCVMSAQESGGAGIEQASGGNIRFYAYVGGSYKVLKGTVDAEPGKAYHVVATYDAAAGKTCLYVNGKPAGEMEAVGTLTFPASTAAHWIAIGGDAAPDSYVQYALKGEVARARMYSHGLSRDEVSALYRQLTFPHPQANQQP